MDLIDRQAVIDEIDEWIKAFRENGHKESAADACLIQDGIIQLPSAQPYTEEEIQKMQDLEQAELDKAFELGQQDAQPEDKCGECDAWNQYKNYPRRQWIPCSQPPETDENVFIARGNENFMSCCIGHYDLDAETWYEDRNWFAQILYDALYWCKMPTLPEPYKEKDNERA